MKLKKFFLFLLVFVFAFTIVSCDKDNDGNGDTSAENYSVTFTVDENTTIVKEYAENTTLTEVMILRDVFNNVAPTKEGYTTKLEWFVNQACTSQFTLPATITKDITVYLKWDVVEPDKFTVSFNTDGGSSIANLTVVDGNTITKPVDPTKDGHIFAGWYVDSAFTTLFDFETAITSNITIYAKWDVRASSHTIKFNSNGGSAIADIEVKDNEKFTKPTNPTKTGSKFIGWYADEALTTVFNFQTRIAYDMTLYARWDDSTASVAEPSYEGIGDELIVLSDCAGYDEGAYVIFDDISGATYTVSYKKPSDTEYTKIDNELIRKVDGKMRADIVGIAAGAYDIKITANEASKEIKNVIVTAYDRSGFAHFKATEGVGAYNNDGTLKENAVVVYVTDDTKNTVKAVIGGLESVGICNIISNKGENTTPLVVRIIGRVGAATWNTIKYDGKSLRADKITGATGSPLPKMNMLEDAIVKGLYNTLDTSVATKLNNLTNRIKYSESDNEFDSYFNMLDVAYTSNVTVEGIGDNAEIFQWGFTWKNCNSIEVRNLTFTNYTEDACSFEGTGNSTVDTYGRYWIHHNEFNKGNNNWDVTYEQDKGNGDGATDFKLCSNVTASYNIYDSCKKTSLIGGGDTQLTKNVTFHHNYYKKVGARLPLGRQANMHFYNNYYYKCTTGQDIRANAFVFSESNYFDDCDNPQKITTGKYLYTVIKSYNDYLYNSGATNAKIVYDRTAALDGKCIPDERNDYTNFDTNAELFYYDAVNKKSDVTVLHDTFDVPTVVKKLAGPHN